MKGKNVQNELKICFKVKKQPLDGKEKAGEDGQSCRLSEGV